METGFKLYNKNAVAYFKIPSFEKAGGVCCAFSTRIGGVSKTPYDTLNFSKKRENSSENFNENLKRFGCAAGFDYKRAVSINYAHSAKIYKAQRQDAGKGITKEPLQTVCDALFTDVKGLPLISFHADCAPLFFYDPVRRAAAVCHAGWRGVTEHIAKNAVKSLILNGSEKTDILAAIGPCISVKHYEVGKDVKDIFERRFSDKVVQKINGRYFADLNQACIEDMLAAGISADNITDAKMCTYEHRELFFSHRRDKGQTGAMAAVAALI